MTIEKLKSFIKNKDNLSQYCLIDYINTNLSSYEKEEIKETIQDTIDDLRANLIYFEVEDSYYGETSYYYNAVSKIETLEDFVSEF